VGELVVLSNDFTAGAFTVPLVGADVLDNPAVARRNLLYGPGAWGVNLGIHKVFRLGETVRADLGADFNNLFNLANHVLS
jgi:hypothetical protein